MSVIESSFILFFSLCDNFTDKAPLLIDNVVVLESESFLQYINFTEEIVYCYLTFGTTQMELNLNSHETVYAEVLYY